MRSYLPGATELVYDNYNALAIGFGPSERASEAIFSIALYPALGQPVFLAGSGAFRIPTGSCKVRHGGAPYDPEEPRHAG